MAMEKYWEVTPKGVFPIMCEPEELKKDPDWLIAHSHQGKIIFENYSRALLCFYERYSKGINTHISTQEVIMKLGYLVKGKGIFTGLAFAREILKSENNREWLENCASTAASEIYEIEVKPNGRCKVAELFYS